MPQAKQTALRNFFEHECALSARTLATELGYNVSYVQAILSRNERLSTRFFGKVVLRWPELALRLRAHYQEEA